MSWNITTTFECSILQFKLLLESKYIFSKEIFFDLTIKIFQSSFQG